MDTTGLPFHGYGLLLTEAAGRNRSNLVLDGQTVGHLNRSHDIRGRVVHTQWAASTLDGTFIAESEDLADVMTAARVVLVRASLPEPAPRGGWFTRFVRRLGVRQHG